MFYTINAPVWRYPKSATGKIIIAIDRQKSWECVSDFRERVVDLFVSQKMSEERDQRFLSRVFLGGLRPQILNILLQNETFFTFKSVTFHAELLELLLQSEGLIKDSDDESEDENMDYELSGISGGQAPGMGGVVGFGGAVPIPAAALGGVGVGHRALSSVTQDGEVFFGEPNKRIDKLYKAHFVVVLYR